MKTWSISVHGWAEDQYGDRPIIHQEYPRIEAPLLSDALLAAHHLFRLDHPEAKDARAYRMKENKHEEVASDGGGLPAQAGRED